MSRFGSTGSIFGQQSTTAPQSNSGLFGSQPNLNAGSPFKFGSQPQQQQTQQTQPQQSSSGLFGGPGAAQQPSLFGSSAPANTTSLSSGLFGSNNSNVTNTNTNQTPSIFGQPQGQSQTLSASQNSTQTKPLFGGFGTGASTNTNATTTLGGSTGTGLFGNTPNANTGFNNKSTFGAPGSNANSLGTGGGGLFGAPPTNSLFGQQPQPQQQQQQQQQQQGLVASVDQASYTLPGVSPSQKLYSSLSSPVPKRSAEESDRYQFESKTPVIRNRIAKPSQNRLGLKPGLPQVTSSSLSGPITKSNQVTPLGSHEPRKWINSYEAFVRERPTTLVIKRYGHTQLPKLLPGPDAPVSSAPPIAHVPIAQDAENLSSEFSPKQQVEPDVSLFHRQANNIVLVQVNPEAIRQGYYMYPKLETLAAMSRSQLTQVKNLVVGREQYGQIEYPKPVDLSRLANLGDILGKLVIFDSGTVCVYPEETTKAPQGRELNVPATISIENAWPRDARTGEVITDVEDRRMIKHILKLRKICEARGGEFVTFTKGVWVFKVPHFSTWGIPADEMIVDDEDEEVLGSAENPNDVGLTNDEVSHHADEFENKVSAVPDVASSPILGALSEDASDFDPEEDDVLMDVAPNNWIEQLYHAAGGVFQAAADSLLAASKPTADLDLSNILIPNSSLKNQPRNEDESQNKNAHHNSLGRLSSTQTAAKLSELRTYVSNKRRVNSDLPLLQSLISNDLLGQLDPDRKQLWRLLSILFNPSSDIRLELSKWLEQKVNEESLDTKSPNKFDTIWRLLTRHRVSEAANLASATRNPHLALLISMLEEPSLKSSVADSASKQLDDWKASRTSRNIPTEIRYIWQVAAGQVPSGVINSWSQLLGMHFWYSLEPELKSVVSSLPHSLSGTPSTELAFIQVYSGNKQLRTAIHELDLFQSFLCLQALLQINPNVVKSDVKMLDTICRKLAELLEADKEYSAAIFVALHISDVKTASSAVRKILHSMPASIALPTEYGLQDSVLHEARAHQKAQLGEFQAQCEHLLSAGMYNEAHKVFLNKVGPQVVIQNQSSQVIDVLKTLEQHKAKIKHWVSGGEIYLHYAEALNATSVTNDTVISLCNACRYAETSTLESKEAISIIAEWVANTSYAQRHIDANVILKMKFAPSQARTQTLQQSARLLM